MKNLPKNFYTLFILGMLILCGCKRHNHLPPQKTPQVSPEERRKQGESLYKKHNCQACHRIQDKGGSNGPELTYVGKRYLQVKDSEEQAKEWFINHLKDPEKFPGVDKKRYHIKMPKYNLSEEEYINLASYLMSLK